MDGSSVRRPFWHCFRGRVLGRFRRAPGAVFLKLQGDFLHCMVEAGGMGGAGGGGGSLREDRSSGLILKILSKSCHCLIARTRGRGGAQVRTDVEGCGAGAGALHA